MAIEFGWQDAQHDHDHDLCWAVFCPDYHGRAHVGEWQFMQGIRRTVEHGASLRDVHSATREAIRNSQSVAKVELATLAIVAPMAEHKAPPARSRTARQSTRDC